MSNRQLTLTAGGTTLTLVHPITDVYPTTGDGMWLGPSPDIFGPPPTIIDEQANVSVAGSRMTPQRHGPRDLVVPISVQVPGNPDELEAVMSNLFATVDAISSGLVRITYTRDDGTAARWIDAYHVGTSRIVYRHDTWPTATIRVAFRAPDPYWTSGTESSYAIVAATFGDLTTAGSYAFSNSNRAFSEPAFQFSTDDSALIPGSTVLIMGDVEVFPRFEIDGRADIVEVLTYVNQGTTAVRSDWWRFGDRDGTTYVPDGSTLSVDVANGNVELDGSSAWENLKGPARRIPAGPGGAAPGTVYRVWYRVLNHGVNTEARIYWRERWLTC